MVFWPFRFLFSSQWLNYSFPTSIPDLVIPSCWDLPLPLLPSTISTTNFILVSLCNVSKIRINLRHTFILSSCRVEAVVQEILSIRLQDHISKAFIPPFELVPSVFTPYRNMGSSKLGIDSNLTLSYSSCRSAFLFQ